MNTICFCYTKAVYNVPEPFLDCIRVFSAYIEEKLGVIWIPGDGGLTLLEDPSLQYEEFILDVRDHEIFISASDAKGFHNGLAILYEKMVIWQEDGTRWLSMEKQYLRDKPDCSYRGVMLDLGRQRHPAVWLCRYIDLLWKNRASHLHLHFSENRSFTLPITAYPKLATDGYAFTYDEIAMIVNYAKEHGIILIPEIDVPGHSDQFGLKYPELFGTHGILPACDEVFNALRTMFTEISEMFPYSPWIHIGGDEAVIKKWEDCERTQAYMKTHRITSVMEMYAEYIRILTEMIFDLGRTPVVWEGFAKEFNNRIDRRTIVIAWESYYQPAYDLAEAGFTLINCSWEPLYIVTPFHYHPPEKVYAHHPWRWEHHWPKSVAYPDGFEIDRNFPVLGSQICAWGDQITDWENWEDGIQLEYDLVSNAVSALCHKLWHLEM